jgi:hypothetical protein
MLYRAPFVHVMPPLIRLVIFVFLNSPAHVRKDVVHCYAKICPCQQATQNLARKGRRWKGIVGDWQHEASCRHHGETNTNDLTLSGCRLCRTGRVGRRAAPSILRLYSESLPSTHQHPSHRSSCIILQEKVWDPRLVTSSLECVTTVLTAPKR